MLHEIGRRAPSSPRKPALPATGGQRRPLFSLKPSAAAPPAGQSEPPPLSQQLAQSLADLEGQRRALDQALAAAKRGRSFDVAELISLQAKVYRYAHEMELYSRVVDRASSAAKTVLTQQG